MDGIIEPPDGMATVYWHRGRRKCSKAIRAAQQSPTSNRRLFPFFQPPASFIARKFAVQTTNSELNLFAKPGEHNTTRSLWIENARPFEFIKFLSSFCRCVFSPPSR